MVSFLYHSQNYQPDVRSYTALNGINPTDYAAVISASGFCNIRGNEQLNEENQLTDRSEAEGVPTLYLCHGAQIKAVHLWGDDAIKESKKPRTLIYSDYVVVNGAQGDEIFKGVNLGDLTSKEYHKYDIVKKGRPYRGLLTDPDGHTVLARHEDSDITAYLMQMHPEYVPKPGEKVNSMRLLINFLDMLKKVSELLTP